MTDKYNIQTFRDFLYAVRRSEEEIFAWFVEMNRTYKEEKENGRINEAVMVQLFEFWLELSDKYRDDVIEILSDGWGGKRPVMIRDITDFSDRYSEIKCEEMLTKLDPIERQETESLMSAVWDRNMRFEMSANMYDWDTDREMATNITVPRENRTESMRNEVMLLCAKVIYNRGNMLVKFYAGRGSFEYAGITVRRSGRWSGLSEFELADEYTNGGGDPFTLKENERICDLKREDPDPETESSIYDNVIYFKKGNW